ncbi:MAG TPA: hypothetical protein DC024_08090 [Clostridiales bacterium]|jgi:hypothetical protein|nr:hypothetical protein [Tissierellia bacterium]MDD4440050.1 hypothetical protein [Tissierellia bacterium]HBC31185.1 hypothetical protein [Clostridiales bacterium]HCS11201.1 hypothetical protein [Clostridiales bacterium]
MFNNILGDSGDSLLFFFLLLVCFACFCGDDGLVGGIGGFGDNDSLLFFFLLLVVLFCSCDRVGGIGDRC